MQKMTQNKVQEMIQLDLTSIFTTQISPTTLVSRFTFTQTKI